MAQFDVYRFEGTLVLDCQSDLLAYLNTRVVVPLLEHSTELNPAARLNPAFEIQGRSYIMATQFVATVSASNLSEPVTSLADHHINIIGAMDVLLTGV
ncbi:MAG: CcdB family protein [Sphingobium sp.]|uniref:CcdB family protein n=1 Tax=Sphingobium sp. CECT 9361 TaxID=2845384 RepID=UPI001E45F7DD|nr:CcdB family protein [Sphingobium sp. CECT 9361]CAH0353226.1 hypothetical protein SPH9361_02392 [Sphingobium sp. CECT 9361]